MSVGYIDTVDVEKGEISTLTDDATIGMLTSDDLPEDPPTFDTDRLHAALLAYRDQFEERHAHLAVIESDGLPCIALIPRSYGGQAVILAGLEEGHR